MPWRREPYRIYESLSIGKRREDPSDYEPSTSIAAIMFEGFVPPHQNSYTTLRYNSKWDSLFCQLDGFLYTDVAKEFVVNGPSGDIW